MDGKYLRDLYIENNIHFTRRVVEAKLYEEPAKWLFIKEIFLPEFYEHILWMWDQVHIGAIAPTKSGRRSIDISPYHFRRLDQNLIDVLKYPDRAPHFAALKGWLANSALPKLVEKINHVEDTKRKGTISLVYDHPGMGIEPTGSIKKNSVFDAMFYTPKETPEGKLGGDTILEDNGVYVTVPYERNAMLLLTGDIKRALEPVQITGRTFISYKF